MINMEDNKALLGGAEEIVAALERACHDCNPTPCCEYEVIGQAAAALIKDQAAQLAAYTSTGMTPDDITAAADRRHNCKIDCLLKKYNEACAQLAVVTAERDAAVADIHRCCDTCEWYRPSCGSIGTKRCSRSYEPSACCVNWDWHGPQGAGDGGA